LNQDIQKDPELSRLYRVSAKEQPPAHLDAAILAAAKREVGDRPHKIELPFFKKSWYVPVSIAAAFVITVSLFPFMKEHSQDTSRRDSQRKSAKTETAAAENPVLSGEELKLNETMILNGGKMPEPALSTPYALATNQIPQQPVIVNSELQSVPPREAASLAKIGNEVAEAKKVAPQTKGFVADPQAGARQKETFADANNSTDSLKAAGASAPAPAPIATAPASAPTPFAMEKSEARMRAQVPQDRREIANAPEAVPAAPASSAAITANRNLAKAKQATKADTNNKDKEEEDDDKKNVIVTPQDWIRKIQQLIQENKLLEARNELDAFRKRYPYYPVPIALKQSLGVND
jgi:hypothetical protein